MESKKRIYDFNTDIPTDSHKKQADNYHGHPMTVLTDADFITETKKLLGSNVNNRDILGYKFKNPNDASQIMCIKYNKNNQFFITYVDNDKYNVVDKGIKSWREFVGDKCTDYFDEI